MISIPFPPIPDVKTRSLAWSSETAYFGYLVLHLLQPPTSTLVLTRRDSINKGSRKKPTIVIYKMWLLKSWSLLQLLFKYRCKKFHSVLNAKEKLYFPWTTIVSVFHHAKLESDNWLYFPFWFGSEKTQNQICGSILITL